MNKLISIVIPAFNEVACVTQLHSELKSVLAKQANQFEIIFVDDGSTDGTADEIRRLVKADSQVRGVILSRNFGHQYALLAGIDKATGDALITMDADMQHPPATIPQLIGAWQQGNLIVQAIRQQQSHLGMVKRFTSKLFYKLFGFLSNTRLTPGAADFRLIDRRVVEELKQMHEHEFFLRGMLSWMGYRSAVVHYSESPRHAGKSKYTLLKMLKLAAHGILSFSVTPIRLSILMGLISLIAAFGYLGYALYVKFVTQQALPGWTSIIILVTFFQSVQFILMGIMGEYIGRIYFESKRRPRYLIAEIL